VRFEELRAFLLGDWIFSNPLYEIAYAFERFPDFLFGELRCGSERIAFKHVVFCDLLAAPAKLVKGWIILDCIVQKHLQVVNAPELPPPVNKICFQKFFDRLLEAEAREFRVVTLQTTFHSIKVFFSDSAPILGVVGILTRRGVAHLSE